MTVEDLRMLYSATDYTFKVNIEDITDEEALVEPERGGNSINWIAGHILFERQNILTFALAEPVISKDEIAIYDASGGYDRKKALPLKRITELVTESMVRLLAALEKLTDEQLTETLDITFFGQKMTRAAWLGSLNFHEAYHCGQIGYARRTLGKPGKISI